MENWGGLAGLVNAKANIDDQFLKGEEGEVVVLGETFDSLDEKCSQAIASKTWFSYRKHFTLGRSQLSPRSFNSDAGWGCVHRSGQMLLIAALSRHLQKPEAELLPLFMDIQACPFSIQSIAHEGVNQGRRVGEWFAPSTIAKVLETLVKRESQQQESICASNPLDVIVADQAMLYPEDLTNRIQTSNGGILLLIPVRLGLDSVDEIYYEAVRGFLKSKLSLGIIGGRPKHSLYFIGFRGKQLIYKDPHKVQSAYMSPETLGCTADPHKHSVLYSEIDPSCLIAFHLSSVSDVDWLTAHITSLHENSRYPFLSLCTGSPSGTDPDAVDPDCTGTWTLDDDGDREGEDEEYVVIDAQK